jgi:cytochrome c1
MKRNPTLLAIPILVLLLSACGDESGVPDVVVPGGDPVRGQGALLGYGCESCHTIPGLDATRATVGPPLTQFARRRFVAGELENTPENVIRWIMNPQSIDPGTAMPNLDVNEGAARDIAAYLYTLH